MQELGIPRKDYVLTTKIFWCNLSPPLDKSLVLLRLLPWCLVPQGSLPDSPASAWAS